MSSLSYMYSNLILDCNNLATCTRCTQPSPEDSRVRLQRPWVMDKQWQKMDRWNWNRVFWFIWHLDDITSLFKSYLTTGKIQKKIINKCRDVTSELWCSLQQVQKTARFLSWDTTWIYTHCLKKVKWSEMYSSAKLVLLSTKRRTKTTAAPIEISI